MHINNKAFFMNILLAGVLGLFSANAYAVVTLSDDIEAPDAVADEENDSTLDLGLEEDTSSDDALIIPPAKNVEESKPINLADTAANNGPVPVVPKTGVPVAPKEVKPAQQVNPVGVLGAAKFGNVDGTIFEQMSDLEKQTAVLSLELRKEQVQNEIDAVKNQRIKAIEEARAAEEEKARKKAEWERDQAVKVIQEQQKLKELDIAQEKLRQERLLKDYKNHMLKEKQKWIEQNASIYKDIDALKKEKNDLAIKIKEQYAMLNDAATKAAEDVAKAKGNLQRENSELQAQISILKARLEAQERELEMERQNPFAEGNEGAVGGESSAIVPVTLINESLSDLYAVMEIRGQGEELYAKLMSKDGIPFMVRKGSVLQNGHVVDEVTSSYIRTDLNGIKDYLYFAGASFWDKKRNDSAQKSENSEPSFAIENGLPSIGKDMFAR